MHSPSRMHSHLSRGRSCPEADLAGVESFPHAGSPPQADTLLSAMLRPGPALPASRATNKAFGRIWPLQPLHLPSPYLATLLQRFPQFALGQSPTSHSALVSFSERKM